VKELEAVLGLERGHTGARAMLAQVFLETNDVKGVERIYREMVHEDPLAVDHYRALAQAWKEAGQKDAYVQAIQAVAILQAADEELDLYWMGDWKRPDAILAHGKKTPALILCPAVFAGLTEPEKAYVIARAIAMVPARLEAVRALPARELEKLVLATVKSLHP